ncbi:hypothetical protein [Thermobispora bispora]|uniref:Uncharacterized protein n=1 Tax=Thermobispora bispora (strain ATCC 19993 / DSM 43833 / CBS 139.67 / JCM 10125 / KCTC 9307 / NBRC 14880 / R51) TaxID=469371 RepID=D6Y320_THEBD|nr:hypothetical protein [Thermobispora bispora]ADG88895.1 hypothetical protein Tbis_2184 [Thermobispora bispora DSM 43833]HLT11356.1 hypothetical protein [Micromonosporaceae bacterium]
MKTNPRADAVRNAIAQRWAGNGRKLESVRNGRRLVFTSQPEFIRNATGDVVGVDAWVRLYDGDGKELPIDPHRIIVNPPVIPRSGIKETVDAKGKATRVLTPSPYEAFIEAVWDSVESQPNPSGWNTAGTVTTIYADEDDGRITCTSSNYSTARAGNGTYNVNPTGNVSAVGQSFASPNYNVFQMFWGFDTSSIGADARITSIDFELNHALDNSATDFVLEIRERDWVPPLSSSHFVPGASLANSGPIVAQRNTNSLPAVGEYWLLDTQPDMFRMANLGTGTVRLFGSSSRTRAGNTPSGQESVQFRFAEQSGTTQDPRLTIVHQTERAQAVETFETNPLTFKWLGTWGWASDSTHTGSFSWKSAAIGNSASTDTTLILPPDAQTLQFWYRVSSESGWDHFRVYRDAASGTPVLEESGNLSWRQSPVIDVSSATTIIFRYIKDTSNASGSDCVWIDDVVLTFPVPSYSGGSSTSVTHSVSGAGRPGPKNGADSGISVSAAAVGRPATSGGSAVEVSVSFSGSGSPGWSDGSPTSITVTSAGNGIPGLLGGSDVSVTVEAVGAGEKGDISGGSTAEVVVLASGDGFASFAEGSAVEVAVSVSSAWTIAIAEGATALVKVVAVGRGIKPTVDITVDVGPSYVVERFGVLESRNGSEIGDNRLSLVALDSAVRETVEVLLSRIRERVEIGETRSSVSVSDARTSTAFEPSRISRGE